MSWHKVSVPLYAIVTCSFHAPGDDQLPLEVGEFVSCVEETEDWYRGKFLGTLVECGLGIFPKNRVRLSTKEEYEKSLNIPNTTLDRALLMLNSKHRAKENHIRFKITKTILAWMEHIQKQTQEKKSIHFNEGLSNIIPLLQYRALLNSEMEDKDRKKVEEKALSTIASGRVILGLPLLVYDENGHHIDHNNQNVIKVYNKHISLDSKEKTEGSGTTTKKKNKAHYIPVKREKRKLTSKLHGGKLQTKKVRKRKTVQVIVEFRALIAKICQSKQINSELVFYLYNEATKTAITECYRVYVGASGLQDDLSMLGSSKTIFKDIPADLIGQGGIYLLCRIVRSAAKDGKATELLWDNCRIPFGWGISPSLKALNVRNTEYSWPLFQSQTCPFGLIPHGILHNMASVTPIEHAILAVSVALFEGEYESLVKKQVHLKDVCVSRIIHCRVPFRDNQQNIAQVYITLEEGLFPQDKKQNTMECVMTVKQLGNNTMPKDSISIGCEDPVSVYRSIVFQGQYNPRWSETILVTIPHSEFSKTYVQIEILLWSGKEQPERKFISYFYPTDTNTDMTLANGNYDLPVYKKSKNLDPIACIRNTASSEHLDRYRLRVRMSLCSNQLSQNLSVNQLITWRKTPEKLADMLNRFSFVDMVDILQCIVPIIKALLEIMQTPKFEMFAYNILIFVLGLLVDDKTDQYSSWTEQINDTFKSLPKTVHQTLLRCMLYYLSHFDSLSHSKYIRSTLRTLPHLMFLLSHFYCKAGTREDNEEFLNDLAKIFSSLNALMTLQDPLKVALQSSCLQVFSEILPSLEQLFHADKVVDIVSSFLSCIMSNTSLSSASMNIEKLFLVQAIANSDFYLISERKHDGGGILNILSKYLEKHLSGSRKERIECSYCLSVILDGIQTKAKKKDEAYLTLIPLLGPLALACFSLDYDSSNILDLLTSFLSIIRGIAEKDWDFYFASLSESQRLDLLLLLCKTWKFINSQSYPAHWLTMWLFAAVTFVKLAHLISKSFTNRNFIISEVELWQEYFRLLIKLQSLHILQGENPFLKKLPEPDLRETLSTSMINSWNPLPNKAKLALRDAIIPQVTQIILLQQNQIRKNAIKIMREVIYFSFEEEHTIAPATGKIIQAICQLAKTEMLSDETCDFLIPHHIEEMFMDCDPIMKEQGNLFTHDLAQLLELFKETKQLQERPEFVDERTTATLRIMEFLKKAQHPEPYITYIHSLSKQHIQSNRDVEAGLTLLMHANMLSWSNTILVGQGTFPSQSESERKVALYQSAISHFESGKDYERAISLLKELAFYYESMQPDYAKLRLLLQRQGEMFRRIMETERYAPAYFHVCFYGNGFPKILRDQEYIYRGFECERITTFIERMMVPFPRATVLHSQEEITEIHKNGPGQYIVIHTVYVSSHDRMAGKKVVPSTSPLYISKYQSYNNVEVFSYTRPFRKQAVKEEDKKNEFKNLCIREFYLATEESFPNILSRSKVSRRHEIELSPIETAIQSIERKNDEVLGMYSALVNDPSKPVGSLTMALNGIIDAEVNGGIRKYREAFLTPEYLDNNPGEDAIVHTKHLITVIKQSIDIVGKALDVHRNVCPANLSQLQEKLDLFYQEKMRVQLDEFEKKTEGSLVVDVKL